MARKSFAGGAQDTTLSSDITAAATTIAVTDGSSYPDGSVGPFAIRLDAGTPNEEKVLVATRTGNTLNGCTRGFDGSTAVSHNAPAPVEHILDADTLDDLSDHVYDTTRDDHTQYLTAARGNAAYVGKNAPATDSVSIAETTTSSTYADLATVGPSVTADVGTSGKALVFLNVNLSNNTAGGYSLASVAASGATTVAAADQHAALLKAESIGSEARLTAVRLFTGLTPGSHTFTAKYRTDSGSTSTFHRRTLVVIPL